MNFASGYVYDNVADDIYEVVSDEEFMEGMDLSDSGESEEEMGEGELRRMASAGAPAPAEVQTSEVAATDATSSAKPSVLDRVMGMLTSSGSRKSPGQSPSLSESHSVPPRSKSKSSKAHHWKSESHSHHSKGTSSKGRMFRRADTNIVSLQFNTLKKPSTMHAGEVIHCAGCEAIMSNSSSIEEDGPDKVWKCEFCGHRNLVDIEEEEKPAADDVTYLIEAALSTTAIGTSGRDESIVVFCIDISGSMTLTTEVPGHQKLRGSATLRRLRRENTMEGPQHLPRESRNVTYISRLQAVQAAVDHQLADMAKEFPHRRVALVTFSSDVSVIGDGSGEVVCVSGEKLMDKDELMKVGAQLPLPKPIKDVSASLSEKIFGLEEGGATALGPAMVIALSLASRQPGSKVILCTDGKSNEGVGKVENLAESDPSPEEFYEGIASTANAAGVSVSVVTISGTDCKLIQLGKLADSTGGQVNIVDPLKLTEEFSNVLADRIIATSVVATFIVHKGLYIGREENAFCRERREIGNVKSDQEISFEFGLRKRKAQKPAQPKPKPNPLDCISEVSGEAGGGDGAASSTAADAAADTSDSTAAEGPSSSSTGAGVAGSAGGEKSGGSDDLPSELPFQVQITYTDVDGTKALRVLTQKKPLTKDRHLAERDLDLNVLALHTERRTSELALQGDYTGSRGVALMNQRLGWRSSHNSSDEMKKRMYRQAFSRVKMVENTVSDKQKKERMTYGRTHSDDEEEEEEQEEVTDMAALPPPPPRASGGKPRSCLKKKMKQRSEEVDDCMANILYQGRTASVCHERKEDSPKK